MKHISSWTLALSPALICTAALAGENPDVVFFQNAAKSNGSEIAAAEVVQKKSDSEALKTLAADMLRDHTAALQTLTSLAAAKGIELPPTAGEAQDSKLSGLRNLTGVAFDKAYVEWQIGAHRDAIALFKAESTTGDDLDARQFALATLPTLQRHLDHLLAPSASESPVNSK